MDQSEARVGPPRRGAGQGQASARATVWIAFLLVAALASACSQEASDYLSADLRARVEQLKHDVGVEQTSAATVDARAALLWEWGNAHVLSGGQMPVYFPARINQVARARFDGIPPPDLVLADVDRFIVELTLKDERPDALGTLDFTDGPPLVAGEWATIEQVYTVGAQALTPGSSLMLARQMMSDQGDFQHEDPADDNYVSIRASRPGVRFSSGRVPLSGMHGAFRGRPTPMVAFSLAEGNLHPGDTVTITYGDRSRGSRGWLVQTFSIDQLLLPVYVDLFGEGHFLTPQWPGVRVVGRSELKSVRGFVPSVVEVGESFELAVRGQDEWFNRPTGGMPPLEVRLNDRPWRRLEASEEAILVVADLTLDQPGVYRFSFRRVGDGDELGVSNPLWVREQAPLRLYWGETHGHSAFAEGQGSPEGYYRFALEDSRLDFVTLSEHDALMDDWEWRRLDELTRQFHEDGRFVTFLGYEWSAQRRQGGHHNVLFRTPGRERVPVQTANDLSLLYSGLRASNDPRDTLVLPHAHNAGDWTRSDGDLERAVEVASLHGTFEWFGNLYLQNGFEVGFLAASDDHKVNPGYGTPLRRPFLTQRGGIAGVWATARSRDSIFDSLRERSVYATTGERMILEATLNESQMGTRQPQQLQRRLNATVMGTSPIDRIDVVKNGEVLIRRSFLSTPLESHAWVQVGFQSSSEVFPPARDNPRPFRVWDGYFRVEGARVLAVRTPGFDNHYSESASLDSSDTVGFYTETRGRMDTLLVELDGAGPETRLHFHLEPHMERGSSAGNVRPPANLPGADFSMAFSDLESSRLEHLFRVDQHTDRVTLQIVDPSGALDRRVELTDLEAAVPGDYYYVRVTQLDGGLAFSSPFWVGERDTEAGPAPR